MRPCCSSCRFQLVTITCPYRQLSTKLLHATDSGGKLICIAHAPVTVHAPTPTLSTRLGICSHFGSPPFSWQTTTCNGTAHPKAQPVRTDRAGRIMGTNAHIHVQHRLTTVDLSTVEHGKWKAKNLVPHSLCRLEGCCGSIVRAAPVRERPKNQAILHLFAGIT